MMLYVVAHVYNKKSGKVEPIMIPANTATDELMRIIKSYPDLVRVSVEFVIGGRSIFKHNLKSPEDLKNFDFFKSHGVGTTAYNTRPQSVGYIDKKSGVRVEYMHDGIRLYPVK